MSHVEILENKRKNLYLTPFSFYAEYDFANFQSLLKLEESFWETMFPTYNYYDYLMLGKGPNFLNLSENSIQNLKLYYQKHN